MGWLTRRVFYKIPTSNQPVWQDGIVVGVVHHDGSVLVFYQAEINFFIFKDFLNAWHDRLLKHVQIDETSHSSINNLSN